MSGTRDDTEATDAALRFVSSMDAEHRQHRYRRDAIVESFLEVMNTCLADSESQLREGLGGATAPPSIIVLSAPRSGSTVFMQCMVSRLELGYPSNLLARFYKAPLTGAMLQRILLGNRIADTRTLASEHGVTEHIEEPHEFGYFWARFLGIDRDYHQPRAGEALEWSAIVRVGRELDDIARIFAKPVLYKNALGCYHMNVWTALENVFVIHLVRDAHATVASILKARKDRLGDAARWWSLRPSNFHALLARDPIDQVIAQYQSIEESIRERWLGIPEQRRMRVSFEELEQAPEAVADRIVAGIQRAFGIPVARRGDPLAPLAHRRSAAVSPHATEIARRLAAYSSS